MHEEVRMTNEAKQAWGEVGEKFSSWGRRLADRYHEKGTAEKADADETERELKRAAKELVDELSKGVSALADTIRDDQAKKELSDALSAVGHGHGQRGHRRDPLEGRPAPAAAGRLTSA
jgi:hypothetical protein